MHAGLTAKGEQASGAEAPPTPPRAQPPAIHPQQAQHAQQAPAAERALHVDIPRRSNTVSEEDSE